MSLRQKAIKGVVWSAIQNWGRQAIVFVVFFLLARLLGPKAFGLVALANVFLAFIQIFLDQGLATAIVQRHELDPEHLDTAFWTNLGMSVLLTSICIGAAGLVADLYNQPELSPIIRWLSLAFVCRGFNSVQEAILRRNLSFKTLAVRTLIAAFFGGMVGVAMAFQGFGVWSLVGQQLVSGLVEVLVLWQASDWRPGFNLSIRHFKELFAFGSNIMGINFLFFFSRRSDALVIGYFLGPVALGYYTIASRIVQLVSDSFIGIINAIALPVFSRMQKEPERLRQAFYTVVRISNLLAFPIFFSLSILAPELVIAVFGKQWVSSIPVMQVLGLMGILYAGSNFIGPIIVAVGKPSWNLGLAFLQAVINLIAFFIAVRWGIVAVAASYVIGSYLRLPISLWVVQKLIHFELTIYLRQYAAPLAGSLAMVTAIWGAKYFLGGVLNSQASLAVYIALGIAVYGTAILLIAPTLFQQGVNLFRSALPQSK